MIESEPINPLIQQIEAAKQAIRDERSSLNEGERPSKPELVANSPEWFEEVQNMKKQAIALTTEEDFQKRLIISQLRIVPDTKIPDAHKNEISARSFKSQFLE